MGVDLTTGTGWPFGGPGVSTAEASSKVVLQRYDVAGGAGLTEKLPEGTLQCLMAVSDEGQRLDLTARVSGGRLDWTAPPGAWRLYAVLQSGPVQKVKRAAPGGAGSVLDPFSVAALNHYLAGFDRAFDGFRGLMPRGHFHDSFEYYGATWTGDFFEQFRRRRGYDLRTQLPALFGDAPEETVARVKCDYRETVSELHLAYMERWTEWCHARGGVSRYQAHGAPGNLIDLYAAADIPETEVFRDTDEQQIPMLKLSSSAAHLRGRTLASSESFTWLGEHFQVSLAEIKRAADFLFLSGVNHLFFHGIPYSPEDAGWPGWLFYASVHLGPNGGLWRDLPELNAYLARCQSILQSGRPSHDVLLYFPVHDLWHAPSGLLIPFATPGRWMASHPFHAGAMSMWERGYGFDAVSDRLLADARCVEGAVMAGGNAYRVIVVPKSRLIPEATLRKLIALARAGATILVQEALPADVPGFGALEKRRGDLQAMLRDIRLEGDPGAEIRRARLGKGMFLVGADLEAMLRQAGVEREPMADAGIRFVRRTHARGHHYFLVNRGERPVEGWVALGTPARSAVILDPRSADHTGVATLRRGGVGEAQVFLRLQPGESRVLRTFTDQEVEGRPWREYASEGEAQSVAGVWRLRFIEGGPALPAEIETRALASWTTLGDAEARRFAGTARYAIEVERPAGDADDWLLDLGRVCESARVRLNGRDVGTLWCAPFQIRMGEFLRPGRNLLEVEVTNLAANRVADLDRRGVVWKAFHEINFVNRDYRPFDASEWASRDSGLVGPVTLVPLRWRSLADDARP
jgi:hypothetical protein